MSLSLTPLTLQVTAQSVSVHAPSQTTLKHPMTGIKAISSDVFGRILSFLPAQQIIRVHPVCQAWRNLSLVNDGCLDLSRLNLSDSELKTILDKASGTRITSINLSNCKNITDAGLAHLSKLTFLSSLNLNLSLSASWLTFKVSSYFYEKIVVADRQAGVALSA